MNMAGREQPSGRICKTEPERFLGRQRHGGAPRGGVPVARDGPRLASVVSRLTSATIKGKYASRRSASPLISGLGDQADATRMQKESKNLPARLRCGKEETHAV